jgi:hypothetical protein
MLLKTIKKITGSQRNYWSSFLEKIYTISHKVQILQPRIRPANFHPRILCLCGLNITLIQIILEQLENIDIHQDSSPVIAKCVYRSLFQTIYC